MDGVAQDTDRPIDGGASPLVEALMRELVDRVARLAAAGEASTIDLKGLPMLLADRDALAERLGEGELACEQIEVAEIPNTLCAHHDDISFSAERMAENFNADKPERLDKDTPHV